jgi:DNA polymerase I-like protein with 3'-5' exonuclease and polymerase domains
MNCEKECLLERDPLIPYPKHNRLYDDPNFNPRKERIVFVFEQTGLADIMQKELTYKFESESKYLITKLGKLPKDSYIITSLCKCLVPGAIDDKQYVTCKQALLHELSQLNAKIIVPIGNTVMKVLTGHSGITNYSGMVVDEDPIIIPLISPAAVLKAPKYEKVFDTHLQKIINIFMGIGTKVKPRVSLVTSKESLMAFLRHMKNVDTMMPNPFATLDFETTTFDYWRPETHVMTMGICADGITGWGIPMEHKKSPFKGQSKIIMEKIKPYLLKWKWGNNNNKYDNKWSRKKYGITINYGPDNMLLGYINDENIPHTLEYQVESHFGAGEYKSEPQWPKKYDPVVDDIVEKVAEYDAMDLMTLLKYNALDAFYAWHVYPAEKALLLNDQRLPRIYKHILERGYQAFMHIEELGMWVDPDRLKKATEECAIKVEEYLQELNSLIPPGWAERNLSPKIAKKGFNWNSPKQVGMLFFQEDGFNFPVLMTTDSGNPSTSEPVILNLAADIEHPVLDTLLDYRKWSKYMSTYLTPWAAKVDPNNRLHPVFNLHGTVTGRLSGEDGVHQVPRDKFIRSIIGAPPGWTFFEIDGSQIELRVAAIVANEETMLRIYHTGGDIHRETAAIVTGKPPSEVTSDERKKAKAVNFGFLYGMGWKKFKSYAFEKYGVRVTDAQAQEFRKKFFEKYYGLPEWHKNTRKLVRRLGYVVSPIGRKRRLPNIFSEDDNMAAGAEREAINSPVQGFASDYVLSSFVDIVLDIILKEDPNFETIQPVGSVHDAQYYYIRNDMLEYWANIIKREFDDTSRLKKKFGYTPPIAIPGDCKVGTHWGDAKDWIPGEPLPFTQR